MGKLLITRCLKTLPWLVKICGLSTPKESNFFSTMGKCKNKIIEKKAFYKNYYFQNSKHFIKKNYIEIFFFTWKTIYGYLLIF